MMIFSFKPSSLSILPRIAASVRTRVVSWKEAADKNESALSEALVIPRITGLTTGRRLPLVMQSFTTVYNSECEI